MRLSCRSVPPGRRIFRNLIQLLQIFDMVEQEATIAPRGSCSPERIGSNRHCGRHALAFQQGKDRSGKTMSTGSRHEQASASTS